MRNARTVFNMRNATASLLALCLSAGAPARAEEPGRSDVEDVVEWKKPIAYTLGGMGIQFVTLVATRQADDDPSFGNFKDAFSDGPRRDDDSALYNFVLHPLWGSETYLRAREANMGMLGSFGFSLGASVTWEYLIESWTEHPSSQDLVYTTGIGWMLGELRYRLKQRGDEGTRWWVDPIHTGLEHWGIGVRETSAGKAQPTLEFSMQY